MGHFLEQFKEYVYYLFCLVTILFNGAVNLLNDDKFIGAITGLGVIATTTAATLHAYSRIKKL